MPVPTTRWLETFKSASPVLLITQHRRSIRVCRCAAHSRPLGPDYLMNCLLIDCPYIAYEFLRFLAKHAQVYTASRGKVDGVIRVSVLKAWQSLIGGCFAWRSRASCPIRILHRETPLYALSKFEIACAHIE
jgi:hypothetical protein